MTCEHKRGDWITAMGYWLCADCYEKLPNRPAKYGFVPACINCVDDESGRQEIVWQAEVAEAVLADGQRITLNEFLQYMVDRIVMRSNFRAQGAYTIAVEILEALGEPFGSCGKVANGWGLEAAHELVDSEMDYWEIDSDGGANE